MVAVSTPRTLADPSLIGVVGPTGAGKSRLSLRLAAKLPGEIIAADSRTVYRGLDIGTAKPTKSDRRQIPHHLLDIAGPGGDLNVARFQSLARTAWQDINDRHRWALLVGGSGLYVDSLLWGYQFQSKPVDQSQRQQLNQLSVEQLQQLIEQRNLTRPENWTNKRYLTRTLERGGLSLSPAKLADGVLVVGISPPPEVLKDNLSRRWDEMLTAGVVDEARWAWREYSPESEALKSNIYRSLRPYLLGQVPLEEAQADFLCRDWQLAKRQLTWWRRRSEIDWFADPEQLIDKVRLWAKNRKLNSNVQK